MNINKNIIKLKIGQNSISNPIVKSKYAQIISTSGIQEAFDDPNLVDDYFLKGGCKVVSDITCRNNIPCELRKDGMIVIVVEEGYVQYQIQTQQGFYGICDNNAWVQIEAGDGIIEEVSSIGPDDFIFVEVGNEKKKIKNKNLFPVTPEPTTYTLTVNPTPADAVVTLNGQITNSITVPQGTNVTINVAKTGYITHNSSVIVNATQTVPITLQAVPVQYTLTVTANPSGSTILLNGQATNTLTVNSGTVINMVVSKAGYITQSEAITMNSNKTRNIILVQDLTPSFPYYWGEIGNIFAANPSAISEANWDTQIKPNGTNGGMSYFPNASSFPADMHKIATGMNYQWWIVLVPTNQSSIVADLANYGWFIWDDLLQAWVDYPSGGIQAEGNVTLDGVTWKYRAVRPTTITRIKFSKSQISGQP